MPGGARQSLALVRSRAEPGDKPLATCRLAGVELRLGRSKLNGKNTTLDGRPWQAPANGP